MRSPANSRNPFIRQPRARRNAAGFTLVELIVALSVAAIFVAIAVPSYRSIINRNSVAGQVNSFMAAANFARSEAVTRGNQVILCKSGNGSSCADDGGWEQGWIVYDDLDNNQTPTNTEIIRVTQQVRDNATLRGNNNIDDNIRFDANGFSFATAGTIRVCDSFGGNRTDIVVAPSGRVRSEANHDGACP